jgi:hypothetical protein
MERAARPDFTRHSARVCRPVAGLLKKSLRTLPLLHILKCKLRSKRPT